MNEGEQITISQKKGKQKPKWKILEPVFFINDDKKIEEDYVGEIVRTEFLTTNNTGEENLVVTNESMDKYLGGFKYRYYTGFRRQEITKGKFFKSKEELIKKLLK